MAKVLIIDDDKIIRDLLRAQFEGRDIDVIEAENGDAGVDLARSSQPKFIVLGMSLPGMTGWQVLPILRTHPDTKTIPVIALTSHDSPELRDDAHSAGCDRYITKPVEADRLFKAVDELIG
jgi:CheY-like chemotaxis protein